MLTIETVILHSSLFSDLSKLALNVTMFPEINDHLQ